MRLTLDRFSRWSDYLLYRIVRRRSVLSGFILTTPFNADFRRRAAVSLPGPGLACMTGSGILTACPSPAPFGFGLAPGLP